MSGFQILDMMFTICFITRRTSSSSRGDVSIILKAQKLSSCDDTMAWLYCKRQGLLGSCCTARSVQEVTVPFPRFIRSPPREDWSFGWNYCWSFGNIKDIKLLSSWWKYQGLRTRMLILRQQWTIQPLLEEVSWNGLRQEYHGLRQRGLENIVIQ